MTKALLLSFTIFISALTLSAQSQKIIPVEIEGWDISTLDGKIAELAVKANAAGASQQDKNAAADAYLERANLFYNAGRPSLYKLAVGDFRRVLRLQPDNLEAREKLELIVSIYQSMERPVPENGNGGDAYNDPNVRFKLKPQPIRFSDEKSASFWDTLPLNVAYVYEFSAKAGQQVVVKMKVDDAAAVFSIYKGHIADATQIISEAKEWDEMIPEDNSYLIKVLPKKDAVNYRLTVSVK
jgi:hypothetical protein